MFLKILKNLQQAVTKFFQEFYQITLEHDFPSHEKTLL